MTTVAAIDCGTNTIKLLVGELPDPPDAAGSADGTARSPAGPSLGSVAVREMRMVRLGQDLDRTGRIADEALERAFAAIDEYAALIREHGAERVRFCATSASRDASNAEVFVAGVRERLGVEPEVVTGDEEAALTFGGAVRHLREAPVEPVLVLDIGGGSTELILGGRDSGPATACSMDIGSVRLHERHLRSDPPTAAEVAACVAGIDAALDGCPVDPAAAATVVGVAGTITTVAAGVLGLAAYDRDAIDQAVLPLADVRREVDRLLGLTAEQRRGLGYVHPGRADVIDAGALILARVLERARVDHLVVSEADILDGIAWSLVQPGRSGP